MVPSISKTLLTLCHRIVKSKLELTQGIQRVTYKISKTSVDFLALLNQLSHLQYWKHQDEDLL